MNLDLGNLRYRAASKTSLCLGHHEIPRSDDGLRMWVTCDEVELDELVLPGGTREDFSRDIQYFMLTTMFNHEQDVVGSVVVELLNRLEQAEALREL